MASSLEVLRRSQRLTVPGMASPGHYPAPSSAQRRFLPTGTLASAQSTNIVHQSRALHVGFSGRHTWTPASSSGNSLLGNRIHRLNLRLSAPTPGEEELCRHWLKNSANYGQTQNRGRTTLVNREKMLERPRTVQTPANRPQRELLPQRPKTAGKRRTMVCATSPNHQHHVPSLSADSGQIASPPSPQRSPISTGIRKLGNNSSSGKRYSSFDRVKVPRNSPIDDVAKIYHETVDTRSQPRPPSARPSETRWRNRARASYSPDNARTGNTGKFLGNTETRRWSLSEAMPNQQNDSKDDDSAYSSSREITVNTDRAPRNSPNTVGLPPRSAPNIRSRDENFHASSSIRMGHKGQGSRVMVSAQDGRPVLYYPRDRRQADNYQVLRRNQSTGQNLLPLRRSGTVLLRPMTQPAMGTQHSANTFRRIPNAAPCRSIENPEDKLIQRNLSSRSPVNIDSKHNIVENPVGPKFYPTPLENDGEVIFQRTTSILNERNRLNSINQYIDPDVSQRIIQWLEKVEENPEVYYGFETDLFGDSVRSSDSK